MKNVVEVKEWRGGDSNSWCAADSEGFQKIT